MLYDTLRFMILGNFKINEAMILAQIRSGEIVPPIISNFLTKNNLPITTKDNLIFNVKE